MTKGWKSFLFLMLLSSSGVVHLSRGKESHNAPDARGVQAIRLPDDFTVEIAAAPELTLYPMFGTFDDRGRLFLCESTGPNEMTTEEMLANPSYVIRLLEDLNGDGVFDTSKVFADRITIPAGAVWHEGSLYVAASPDFLRFTDTNDDGVADKREVILTGWTLNVNAAALHGPFLGPDGWFYLTDARRGYKITTKEGTLLEGKGARVWRCRTDGTGLEWISAGGFDNPVELVFTPAGEVLGTMTYFTDPRAGERDAIMHWVEGGVYPKPHPVIDELKRTGDLMPVMTKFARVAPCGLLLYRSTVLGKEYQGNLFSTHFNTHRILRHILHREGASFRTEDEEFLVSSDPDFHPTDVIEDADGSLLVIDTGGWFIKGCPVSRLAKPEIRGAVYRVRKKNAPKVTEPRGFELKLEALSAEKLPDYLNDPRPVVRDQTLDRLVQLGDASVSPLQGLLDHSASADIRCSAVFGLFRIGTPAAMAAVRTALDDRDQQVRVAAARVAGQARDKQSISQLMRMAGEDEPAARRQAAIALAQLKDTQAVGALLAASAHPDDRFVEHSIIYALMSLQEATPLFEALSDSSSKVRKAALIALDQMTGSTLRWEHLSPLLMTEDRELRHAAFWVASHHPEWSEHVLASLRTQFQAPGLGPEELADVQEVLVSFCNNAAVQSAMAELLGDDRIDADRKLLALEAIDRCQVKEFPKPWISALANQLKRVDTGTRSRALTLIRSRGIKELAGDVERIAGSTGEETGLRIAAVAALVRTIPELPDRLFELLASHLDTRTEAPTRLLAAQALSEAKLKEGQLLALVRNHLTNADPLTWPSLLRILRRENNPEVQKTAASFLKRFEENNEERLRKLHKLTAELPAGDVERGRKIFFGQKAACSSCHTAGSEGEQVGPDLTSIGAIRSRHDLMESILFPSASFVREHEPYRVETAGDVYSGVLTQQTSDAVVLITGPRSKVRIARDQIVSMKPAAVSLMPDGFEEALSRSELADLIAFLESLK